MNPDRPNIILVVLDTFRADYLSAYGGSKRLATLESIAKRGTLYKHAVAPATYTAPSHLSMFLGKRVFNTRNLGRHASKANTAIREYVGRGEITLARSLEYLGYKTALFSSNAFLDATIDLSDGFSRISGNIVRTTHRYSDILGKITSSAVSRSAIVSAVNFLSLFVSKQQMGSLFLFSQRMLGNQLYKEYGYYSLDRGAESLNSQLGRYLEAERDSQPGFLLLNYMEAHEGYPTQLVSDGYVEQDRWLYMSHILDPEPVKTIRKACDKRLAYLDEKMADLLRLLKRQGMLDNTKLIITSDHGQAFMEHDQMYHFVFPYEQLSRVPLIVADFKNGKQVAERKSVEDNVSLTGLYDTIKDIGYGAQAGGVGGSEYVFCDHIGILNWWATRIFKTLRSKADHFDAIYRTLTRFDTNVSAVYYKNYKLMHFYSNPEKDALYDIAKDKEESTNLIKEKRSTALQMLNANRVHLGER